MSCPYDLKWCGGTQQSFGVTRTTTCHRCAVDTAAKAEAEALAGLRRSVDELAAELRAEVVELRELLRVHVDAADTRAAWLAERLDLLQAAAR